MTAAATSATTGSPWRTYTNPASERPDEHGRAIDDRVGSRSVAELPKMEPRAHHGRPKVAADSGQEAEEPRRAEYRLVVRKQIRSDHAQESDDGESTCRDHERPRHERQTARPALEDAPHDEARRQPESECPRGETRVHGAVPRQHQQGEEGDPVSGALGQPGEPERQQRSIAGAGAGCACDQSASGHQGKEKRPRNGSRALFLT